MLLAACLVFASLFHLAAARHVKQMDAASQARLARLRSRHRARALGFIVSLILLVFVLPFLGVHLPDVVLRWSFYLAAASLVTAHLDVRVLEIPPVYVRRDLLRTIPLVVAALLLARHWA